MDQVIYKISWVQSKSYSGFFRVSNNTTPYKLILTKSNLSLNFLGIPFVRINLDDIISVKYLGDEWVVNQRIFNGVLVKYKKRDKIKERVITIFDKEKSKEFFKIISKLTASRMK